MSSLSDDLTLRELMHWIPRAFQPEAAEGIEAVVQYHLTGLEAGDWVIHIQDGQCQVMEGVAPNPRMTLVADSQDYKDFVLGRINATQAVMSGKFRLVGDLNLAMRLRDLFQRD